MTTVVTSPARPAGTVRALLAMGWLCVASVSSAETVRVVEFVHDGGIQFLTADANELRLVDALRMDGWERTGFEFMAYDTPGDDRVPVCRFNSARWVAVRHFYTAFPEECEALKGSGDWIYEGHVFHVPMPDASGACAAGAVPQFRYLHARHRYVLREQGGPYVPVPDGPQHRLTPARPPVGINEAWSAEGPAGIAFCLPASFDLARSRLAALAAGTWEMRIDFAGNLWQVLSLPLRMTFGPVTEASGSSGWDDSTVVADYQAAVSGQWGGLPVSGSARWRPLEGKVVVWVSWDAGGHAVTLTFPYAEGDSIRGSAFVFLECSWECTRSDPFVLVGERH